ncbi:hypothetical protein CY35_02G102400 [Sphagnum magellanicum]|nr:hypothetical protein CY35_02G102400 [Sphagnum magellanicum]
MGSTEYVCFIISSACTPVTSSLSRYKYSLSAWSVSEFQAKTWQQEGRGQQKEKHQRQQAILCCCC